MTVLFLSWTQLSSIGGKMGVGPRSSYGVEDYIIAWGEHHQKSGSNYRHAPGGINLYFEESSDAVLFKLTWL